MALAFFKPKDRANHPTNLGERRLESIPFRVFKFNNRPRPRTRDKLLIVSCLSEFGCETVGCVYCIPRLIRRFPGRYIIGMGWYGREYLYRHLLDEFWEMDESCMWLRDLTYAFHHRSDNLKRLEEGASRLGTVVPSVMLGNLAVSNTCKTCGKTWTEWRKATAHCPACNSTNLVNSFFGDTEEYKKTAVRIPTPGGEALDWAEAIMPPRCVGVFARNRTTYGRNLPADFYVKLVEMLESKGYGVIWLGEKQSTLACPVPHVTDLSRSPHGRDLEKTLAVISRCEFTIQFWTASTRLAGMMGTPFVLFESPEQIYCTGANPGQEGRRLDLMTFGKKKTVIAHYKSVLEDQGRAIGLAERAIDELVAGNCDDLIGLVEDEKYVAGMRDRYYDGR